ncbi:MAG: alpha-2-macroglobulin, partial [Chloroflexi bacterium]|nr:alpha-2-macroglobulin [Chloroflexota bacterium]
DADDKSVTSSVNNLYEARGRLDTYARSYLALAIAKLDPKDSRVATLLSDINSAAITSSTGVHWEENGRDWWNMNSDTRSTAIVLSAMSQLDPQNKLNVNIVRWLMQARKAQGGWETTQETAWSLIGLTDYMVSTGELKASYNYNVLINDNKLGGGKADDSNYRQKIDLQVKIADMFKDQANRIIFDRGAGSGKLYYSAYLTVYQNVKDIKAMNKGVIVARQYFAQDGKCGTKGNAACSQVTGVNVGQDVTVKVTVIAPNDLYHVVVEDPFPAGMEQIDTSLRTTSVVGKAPTLKSDDPLYYGWGWWWFSKTDIRDNKIMLSASVLPKGTYVYTYSLHASLAGTYQVIPTTASEFYFPDVMGRGEGVVFTIK